MDGPCSTVGSDSSGVVRAEHRTGPQRNVVSSDPYCCVAGCCEHRQDPSDFLKGVERFHLATLNLSSSYSFMINSRKPIQWIKPLRDFLQLFCFFLHHTSQPSNNSILVNIDSLSVRNVVKQQPNKAA